MRKRTIVRRLQFTSVSDYAIRAVSVDVTNPLDN